jgi:hypothetical protein
MQYVYIREISGMSRRQSITCGVPQGSILGPLLFLLYVNDIFVNASHMDMILFADDTNLLIQDSSIVGLKEKCERELPKVADYLAANKLSLNIKKTKSMLFHTTQRQNKKDLQFDVSLNGVQIERVSDTKFLGVMINHNLTWKSQMSAICIKIGKMTGVISRFRNLFDRDILKKMYTAFILPHLQYGIAAWGNKANNRIITLHKRVIRIIANAHYRAHTDPLFNDLNLLKIHDLHLLRVLKIKLKIDLCKSTPHIENLWKAYLLKQKKGRDVKPQKQLPAPSCTIEIEKQLGIVHQIVYAMNDLIANGFPKDSLSNINQVKKWMIGRYWSVCPYGKACYVCNAWKK